MTFRHLFLVFAAILLASSGAAARVPKNATATTGGNWVCDSGYKGSGNKCISRSGCDRKPTSCLRTFIKKGNYEFASVLYNENRELFLSSREKKRRKKELHALATHLQDSFNPRFDALSKELGALKFDPLDSSTWPLIAQTLSSANKILDEYRSHHILAEPEYQAASFPNFAAQVYGLIQLSTVNRRSAFLAYDHTQKNGFFESYPGPVIPDDTKRDIVSGTWGELRPFVMSFDRPGLLQVVYAWAGGSGPRFDELFGANIKHDIADAYYNIVVDDLVTQRETTFEYLAKSFSAGNAVGLRPRKAITSRLLMMIADTPGKPNIKFDLRRIYPIHVTRKLPSPAMLASYDVVLVLGINNKTINIRTKETKTVQSKYHVRDQTISNPAYISAQTAYNTAVNNYSIANSNYQQAVAAYNANVNFGTSFNKGFASGQLGKARGVLTRAESNLKNTKPTITAPVYQNYEFSVSTIAIERQVNGTVAMMTSASPNAQTTSFVINDDSNLQVAVGAHPKDAGSAKRYKTAEYLRKIEGQNVSLMVADVFRDLDGADVSNESHLGASALIAMVTKPTARVPVVSSISTTQPHAATAVALASHPAINGVVVVKSPLGGVGTGFFVASDILLTNYHVVEGLNLVEIEFFDGRSGTGQVIGTDIDRDLALIRTNVSGQSLELYSGTVLPLGATVTAIGHPSGLNFTLTRGIISAVREQQATSSLGLGAKHLFVQTDTAISPGNSGGPLLLDGKVIGINTQKLVDVNIEGIGFALHYTEIARFLAVSMSN